MQRLRVRPRAGPGPTPRLLTRPLLSNRACRSIARATGQATQPGAAVQHQERVTGACYEEIIDVLARRAMAAAAVAAAGSSAPGRPACRRHVVGVAGAPGSGKSTLAVEIMQRINALAVEAAAAATAEAAAAADGEGDGQQAGTQVALQGPRAVVLPMDGFHYYRRELDAMPDPKEAHARRGAPWTFDAAKFVEAVRRVRQAGEQEVVLVPSFDHGVGDPVEDDIAIPPEAAVVLVEGNYVLLDDEPWRQLRAQGLLDEAWFVECPLDTAMERVFQRQTGIGLAPEVSRTRIATNDRPNGELIAASARFADVLVPSTVPFAQR